MPAIKELFATIALLITLCASALAGDAGVDRTAPRRDSAEQDRYRERREAYEAATTSWASDNNSEESTRAGRATPDDAPGVKKPRQQRGQPLPVRFEPSTRRARGPVVQASALEPIAESDATNKLAPAKQEKSLALAPQSAGSGRSPRTPGSAESLLTLGGSLAIVVGLFLLVAWVMRRGMPKSVGLLPHDVLEVLGRAPLAGKHQVHLLRCGNKMLLVSVTASGVETLTEITDPLEVDRISGLCQQSRRGSSTKMFQHVLGQFEQEPTLQSFVGEKSRTRLDLSSFESIGRSKRREGVDG